MWVHNEVRADAMLAEREVFLWYNQPYNSFLTMAGAEFVSKLWPPAT